MKTTLIACEAAALFLSSLSAYSQEEPPPTPPGGSYPCFQCDPNDEYNAPTSDILQRTHELWDASGYTSGTLTITNGGNGAWGSWKWFKSTGTWTWQSGFGGHCSFLIVCNPDIPGTSQ